jgi:predicted nucleic-acid-binding protein
VIALDTNVLVRILVEDDAQQTAAANRLVERALAEDATLFLPSIVLCETAWVLARAYRFPRADLVRVLTQVLATRQLDVENAEEAERALAAYATGRGDLADYLIRERAHAAGAHVVATFDRAVQSDPGFVSPDPASWDDGVSFHEAAPAYVRRRRAK